MFWNTVYGPYTELRNICCSHNTSSTGLCCKIPLLLYILVVLFRKVDHMQQSLDVEQSELVTELMTNVQHYKMRCLFLTSYINILCSAPGPDNSIYTRDSWDCCQLHTNLRWIHKTEWLTHWLVRQMSFRWISSPQSHTLFTNDTPDQHSQRRWWL